jgi:hypothetical protein
VLKFKQQARFSYSRFAIQKDDLSSPLCGVKQGLAQQVQLALSTNKRREAALCACLDAGLKLSRAGDRIELYGRGQARQFSCFFSN